MQWTWKTESIIDVLDFWGSSLRRATDVSYGTKQYDVEKSRIKMTVKNPRSGG